MNIKKLKEMIKNLPDDMPVVECYSGNTESSTRKPDISVRAVYKFNNTLGWMNGGKPYEIEFCRVYEGREAHAEYTALVFYTEE